MLLSGVLLATIAGINFCTFSFSPCLPVLFSTSVLYAKAALFFNLFVSKIVKSSLRCLFGYLLRHFLSSQTLNRILKSQVACLHDDDMVSLSGNDHILHVFYWKSRRSGIQQRKNYDPTIGSNQKYKHNILLKAIR